MDHDRLFKELLTTFFAEFLGLFLPKLAAGLDRDRIEFVDKEVFTDLGSGERHQVELLAKVRLRGGEAFILVHVENQSSWRPDFPERMFRYFSLIRGKFGLPVYPVALFSFDRPTSRVSNRFDLKLFDFDILRFQFQAIQLNTLNWRKFIMAPNPVASALMTKMQIAERDRPRVRFECLKMSLTLKLDPARSRLIGIFMGSYLKLSAEHKTVYHAAMKSLAPKMQEEAWSIDTAADEVARMNERFDLVTQLLTRRLGAVPRPVMNLVAEMNTAQAGDFLEAFLGSKAFKDYADVKAWIQKTIA